MRRGFKTEANALAQEVRAEMKLGPLDPLNPFQLAQLLEIPVWSLTEMQAHAPAVAHLLHKERSVFSAVTVFRGHERTIVHNDGHHQHRQHSNIAHELAHGLLLHPATPALDDRGCREWNNDIEEEASWLAGVLLVTEEATIEIAKGRWTKAEASTFFGVSQPMIQFRVNATGAVVRVQRMQRWNR